MVRVAWVERVHVALGKLGLGCRVSDQYLISPDHPNRLDTLLLT